MKLNNEAMKRFLRSIWFAAFLGKYEWYRKLYGGLWAHVHVDSPINSCMWLTCPAGSDESYRECLWRGTPEFRNYDQVNSKSLSISMTGTPDSELLAKLRGDQSVKDEIKRRLDMIDKLLAHCDKDDGECGVCGEIVGPSDCDMHFHHDGCPVCACAEQAEVNKVNNNPFKMYFMVYAAFIAFGLGILTAEYCKAQFSVEINFKIAIASTLIAIVLIAAITTLQSIKRK